jgi:hypothetical protein
MKVIAALTLLALATSATAATRCEIQGDATHWAYDSCMGQFETDDELHPGVAACADRALALIRAKGSCPAKRIFKGRMCALLQKTEDRRHSFKACMTDRSVVGSTVKNDGL